MQVRVSRPITDERQSHFAAREVSALGPPAPSLAAAKSLLGRRGAVIAKGVTRDFARQIATAIQNAGGAVDILAAPARRGVGAVAFVIVLLLIGGGGILLARHRADVFFPTAATTPITPPAPSQPAKLTTQEISDRALRSTVKIACGDRIGTGFFVDPEVLLTNAHVACAMGKSQLITLHDGKVVAGETIGRNEDVDVAAVHVIGATVPALPLGDATSASPGDRIVFVGTPKGLSFTVNEGKLSFVGRSYHGVGYLQFDASVNPGNSGGPMLNDRGEAVGIVSMKLNGADGIGFALPVQYAYETLGRGMAAEQAQAWLAFKSRMLTADGKELERFDLPKERPSIAGVRATDVGLIAVILERRDHPPAYIDRMFELRWVGGYCSETAHFEEWTRITDLQGDGGSIHLHFLSSRDIAPEIFAAYAILPIQRCAIPNGVSAELVLSDGHQELDRVTVPANVFSEQRTKTTNVAKYQAAYQQQIDQQNQVIDNHNAQAEASWRAAFSNAKARVEMAKADVARAREKARQPTRIPGSGEAEIRRCEELVRQAEQELNDLEREASNAAIPREWR